MIRVSRMQRLHDRCLGGSIDLAHEILGTLDRDGQPIEILGAAGDYVARAACRLDGDGEKGMHGVVAAMRAMREASTRPLRKVVPAAHSTRNRSLFMTSLLDRIRIVMCATSHPGNIGAAARAMNT